MTTRAQLLREIGRSEFTVRQLAERAGISVEAARSRIARYLEEGLVKRTPYVEQYVDEKGQAKRGRPSHLYQVR